MNISYRWLQDLAPTIHASPAALQERLSAVGAPVDEAVALTAGVDGVVIARVEEVRPHPNADRLRLCTVNAGGEVPLQVVCGAPNVKAGRYYPFAPVGAELPGGVAIRRAKLRGETSEGMLCSARELGLGRDHAGLMELNGEWEPGAPLVATLGLDDVRLVVDVTPNRPELLSHVGVARELAPGGADDLRFRPFPGPAPARWTLRPVPREGDAGGVHVTVEDVQGCSRYTAAVVRGVGVGPSPEWLATRLRAVGVRPINNVVDATNYVLYELGQPLHAFDLDCLQGGSVVVRQARPDERITTLDGVERTLQGDELVIADAREPVALAGVMGGERSEVTTRTTNLFLECARFDPATVRRTARRMGLVTDAAHRFERGVDPQGQPVALQRVVELIVATAGGTPDPEAVDVHPSPCEPLELALRPARVEQVLGVTIPAEEVRRLLKPIGFGVQSAGDTLQVAVPGYRPDVTAEIDLVEEIARRRGYDTFPERLQPFRPSAVPADPGVALDQSLRALFLRWGFLEARTTGFASAADGRVPLLAPLSAEEGALRDSLVPGLLRRAEFNFARGVRDVRLFEIGTVFSVSAAGEPPREERRVAAVFTGATRPLHWTGPAPDWDGWDLKALLEEVAAATGGAVVRPGAAPPALAGPAGTDWLRLEPAGGGDAYGGGSNPAPAELNAPAWAGRVWFLEVRLPAHSVRRDVAHTAIPSQPALERDLALVGPLGTAAEAVERVVRTAAGELLEWLQPFDRYAGKGVPEGMLSVAWRLRFRAPDRTLTDAEADAAVERVLRALETELSVRLR